MEYFSTNHNSPRVDLRTAVLRGLPPDNGLYMPDHIDPMPMNFFKDMADMSLAEIGFEVINHLTNDELPDKELQDIIKDAFNFPVINSEVGDIQVVELWHGPTMAFKDFGARFMSRLFSYFIKNDPVELTILTATSGDTGGAVAAGFFNVPNIEVVVLYPEGKISEFQKQQITTWGGNIQALAIKGNFDDCQSLVKEAFLDDELQKSRPLSSANSINLARLIPQTVYYFEALKKAINGDKNIVVSVPSGNFGNLTAGVIAQKLGLPVNHFIAATNINNIVPDYLSSSQYNPQKSKSTISNAMDVGNPSNFYRLLNLFDNNYEIIKKEISGSYFNDHDTLQTIENIFCSEGYILDPHSAIGFQALIDYKRIHNDVLGFSISTAHPYKFKESLSEIKGLSIPIPKKAELFLNKNLDFIVLDNDYNLFKSYLLD